MYKNEFIIRAIGVLLVVLVIGWRYISTFISDWLEEIDDLKKMNEE